MASLNRETGFLMMIQPEPNSRGETHLTIKIILGDIPLEYVIAKLRAQLQLMENAHNASYNPSYITFG